MSVHPTKLTQVSSFSESHTSHGRARHQNRDAAANCWRLAPVTHAGRAASSPEIVRPVLTVCLTVFPFEFRPRTFTIGFYGKNLSYQSLWFWSADQTLDFSGLRKASVSDLCSLLHHHSRGSHNRRTDDGVTMDLDSDNLDEQQDECIDEGDSEMARGSEASPTASGVQLPFETNSIWIFSTSILPLASLRVFHTRSTIGVRNSAFDFGGRWSTDFFRQCSEKVLESTAAEKTTNARIRILSVETDELDGPAILFSLDRALPSLHHRALFGKLPELDDISSKGHDFVSIDENGATVPVPSKARPTTLAFPGDMIPKGPVTLYQNRNPSKASGPDNISSAELKLSAKCIAGKIATIFNESLRSGDLPTEFKTGHVIPLLKPGKTDTTNPASYRGITLTPVLSKVLERVVYNQVTAFLNETAALNDQQYGFRKGYSCVDLLTVAVDDWLLARDQKLSTAMAFLDLSKAFDNVRHQQLLIFLQRFHIGGTVLRWFSNYLTGRSHRVVVNDQASDEFICTKGVPQGSVMGPLLFNLCVADLHSIAARYNVSLPAFADDMSLYCSRNAMEYACSDVSKALTSISSELESRGLTVNCEKTVAMVIHPRSSKTSVDTPIDITCGRTTIPLVDSTRMLGVIIDSNLSWKEHVDHVCLKVNRKIGALRRSFRQLCPVARRLFYLSIIQPDFDFGSSAFIPNILMSQRKRLVATWRRAVRAVAFEGTDDWPTWTQMGPACSRNHLPLQTWHCPPPPPDLRKKLKSVDHGRTTRGASGNYVPYRSSSTSGTVSFSNRAPLIWNSLPNELQEAGSVNCFKRLYLKLLSDPHSANALDLAINCPHY